MLKLLMILFKYNYQSMTWLKPKNNFIEKFAAVVGMKEFLFRKITAG